MPKDAQLTLFEAAEDDDVLSLGNILSQNSTPIDLNARNADGETALMLAASRGSARIIQQLLSRHLQGLPDADITLALNVAEAAHFGEIVEEEGKRGWGPMPLTAAELAGREGFIALKKAILDHLTMSPADWVPVIDECNQMKERLYVPTTGPGR